MIRRLRILTALLCLLLACFAAVAQEGRIVRETIYSPSLEGNLLVDSPDRQVTIYLPPSYDTEPGRYYPAVYLIHGYTGNHDLWMGGGYIGEANIADSMKSWLEDGKVKEVILVMPNSHNRFRGSFYTNSTATGNWADYIAKDLVKYIDSNYRTLPQRESRGVMGHSMGGYGAVRLAMQYPEIFSCLGGLAGAYINRAAGLQLDSPEYADASTVENWEQFDSLVWHVQARFAMSAAFSPNPDRPPFYCDFPFTYTDTDPRKIIKNQAAYDKHREHDVIGMAETRYDALMNMRAIYIDCGANDTGFDFIGHSRELHEKLNSLGIEHVYREFPGNHTSGVMTSTGNALEVFSEAMAFKMMEDEMIANTPDNREIYYRTRGTGPELLLFHGGWPTYFEPLVELLSPQYRCISFDRLGFRRSTRLDRNWTVEEQVTGIEAVHNSVTSEPAWIFGWSSGGNFALAYALSYPDRVKGIILLEPALYAIYPPEEKPPEVERMQNVVIPLFQQGQVEEGWNEFIETIFQTRSGVPLTEENLENMRSCGYEIPVAIAWCPSEAELRQVTQPVLIIEGDQSPAILRNICRLLDSQLVNSKLVTLEGQNHSMPNEAPKLVAEKITAFIMGETVR